MSPRVIRLRVWFQSKENNAQIVPENSTHKITKRIKQINKKGTHTSSNKQQQERGRQNYVNNM